MLRTFMTTALTSLAMLTPSFAADQIEGPEFEVIKAVDGVELRAYATYLVAEVDVKADDRRAASQMGFAPLASYIFGKNRPGEKIAMTAPVTTQPVTERQPMGGGDGAKIAMTAPVTTTPTEDGLYTIRFTMPKKWTMETLPKPESDSVRLIEVPAKKLVAAGYVGPRNEETAASLNAKLDSFAAANDIVLAPGMISAGYDGPNTPAAKRRWEVMREVLAD
ncbi:heme-binding protein [Ahrensia sp. R2A130]|uniref:SOUL family heme-binding protein n=1 Tax=Ahrensia sp. R2A130 TaxID=744979 RepID=UPI0001E0D08E|nr:heme-binding protein [Ahrensia sp. R2A130]EFL90269.1 soul heme-binding protein [Ahrensia sp. R2A130]